jgi:hypothetical protein
MMRFQWFAVSFLCVLALITVSGCGSDSESSGTDTSSSGADTSSSGADTSATDTSSSGADTSSSGAGACNATVPAETKTELSYEADIKPLLESKSCLDAGCHSPFNGFVSADLDLSQFPSGGIPVGETGPAYVACDAANSKLIKYTYPGCRESQPKDKQMPPSGAPFTEAEAALIFQWIQEGGEATFNAATCGK